MSELTTPAPPELADCFEQGLALLDAGAWEPARALFSRALALDATRTGLWHNRAWCHLQLGDLPAAQADLQSLLRLAPGHAAAQALLGRVALAQGDVPAGTAWLDQAWAAAAEDAEIARQALCAQLLRPGAEAQAVERALRLGTRGQLDEPTARQLAAVLALADDGPALGQRLWRTLCTAPQAQGWMFEAWWAFCQHHRQWDEAALAATLWRRHLPQSVQAQRALMQALADQGDLAALLPMLLEQARLAGPGADVMRELAQGLLEARVEDGLREAGLTVLAHALSLHPEDAMLWLVRGTFHAGLYRHEAALDDYRQALRCAPSLASARSGVVCSLAALGHPEQALLELRRWAAGGDPGVDEEEGILGTEEGAAQGSAGVAAEGAAGLAALRHAAHAFVMRTQGQLPQAEASLRAALALHDSPATQWSLGAVLLTQGRYAEGWALWRSLGAGGSAVPLWHKALALGSRPWRGDVAAAVGRTLLVVAENGLGDTVQFVRFLPALQAQGVQVILCTQPGTAGLMRSLHPHIRVLEAGEPLPQADLLCSVWDLPMLLDVQLHDVHRWGAAHWLRVPPEASAAMARRLRDPDPRLQPEGQTRRPRRGQPRLRPSGPSARPGAPRLCVAVAWRGQRSFLTERSVGLAQIAALNIPGVRWFSLQKELEPGEEVDAAQRMGLHHEAWSLEEAAQAMSCMDMVVSVDTVFCHLAGALGLPTLILLPLASEWRWGGTGPTTAWYPQARLLRQQRAGDWTHPLAELKALLLAQGAP